MSVIASPRRDGISRRDIFKLAGGAACACCAAMAPQPAQAKWATYCISALSADESNFGVPLRSTSDPAVRDYLGREAVLLEQYFRVTPSLFVQANYDGAHATWDDNRIDVRTRGRIVLGETRVNRTKNEEYGLLRLSAVLTHEVAHIFQVATNTDRTTLLNACGFDVKMVELHADYLAGTYMALRSQKMLGAPAELAILFFGLGDRNVQSNDHHGTEGERFLAFTGGYKSAVDALKQGSMNVEYASSMGLLYVRNACKT